MVISFLLLNSNTTYEYLYAYLFLETNEYMISPNYDNFIKEVSNIDEIINSLEKARLSNDED